MTTLDLFGARATAEFSACGTYRYWLSRIVDDRGDGRIVFCMLNPSTADAEKNDPTVRRCIDFAGRWGARELVVVNLFAYRSTDPYKLRLTHDPVGPENNAAILRACDGARKIVAAWGTHGSYLSRDRQVVQLLDGHSIFCLGVTKDRDPRHPLYVPAETPAQLLVR